MLFLSPGYFCLVWCVCCYGSRNHREMTIFNLNVINYYKGSFSDINCTIWPHYQEMIQWMKEWPVVHIHVNDWRKNDWHSNKQLNLTKSIKLIFVAKKVGMKCFFPWYNEKLEPFAIKRIGNFLLLLLSIYFIIRYVFMVIIYFIFTITAHLTGREKPIRFFIV